MKQQVLKRQEEIKIYGSRVQKLTAQIKSMTEYRVKELTPRYHNLEKVMAEMDIEVNPNEEEGAKISSRRYIQALIDRLKEFQQFQQSQDP